MEAVVVLCAAAPSFLVLLQKQGEAGRVSHDTMLYPHNKSLSHCYPNLHGCHLFSTPVLQSPTYSR